MTRPRVLLADDHRLLREAFARLIEPECEVVGGVADGRAVLAEAPTLRPDIVVMDVAMPLLNGLDAARQLRQLMPKVKVIFLTMNEDPDIAAEAFRVGALGLPAEELGRVRAADGDPRRCLAGGRTSPRWRPRG